MSKVTGYVYFFGAALAAIAAAGGCSSSSSSSSPVGSALGESCARTSDCASSLVCIALTCVAKGGAATDGGVVVPVGDGGTSVTTPDGGPVATADAGPPHLSARGESCFSTADCAAGLSCNPDPEFDFGGVCDVTSYGISITGKTCSGECNTAADCCELPVFTTTMTLLNPQSDPVDVHNCADVLDVLGATGAAVCSPAPASTSPLSKACFLYQTYCQCAATTWSCTNNQCAYGTACTAGTAANTLNGCPSQTRTSTLNATCTGTTCGAAPTVGICSADADCEGHVVSDSAYVDATCRSGDCACINKGCYVKCASELDCGQGYSCNATSHICTQNGTCSTDTDCATAEGNVTAKCNAGACTTTCQMDSDCSQSGLLGTYTNSVCGTDGLCHQAGCSSDADCDNSAGGTSDPATVHKLCVTPPSSASTANIHSAVTN